MSKQKIIVVGNGMVGHKFIENMIEHPDYDQYEVVTFSEEPRLAYDRVQLSYYFAGKTVDELMLTSPDYYDENGVRFIVSDKVVNIDHANKKVSHHSSPSLTLSEIQSPARTSR
mgnify:CR=1 FL=1